MHKIVSLLATVGLLCTLIVASPAPVLAAANCTFSSATISFGNYDVYGGAITITGTISASCSGGGNPRPVLTISQGGSGSFNPRKMSCTAGACLTNGYSGDKLEYNLYTTAALSTIWGDPSIDATTGSVSMGGEKNATWSTSVYGYIPAAIAGSTNDVSVGTYSDSVTITMNY